MGSNPFDKALPSTLQVPEPPPRPRILQENKKDLIPKVVERRLPEVKLPDRLPELPTQDDIPTPSKPSGSTLEQAETQALLLTHACERRRGDHQVLWQEHKRQHHERRLEIALEREEADDRFVPSVVQRARDELDDTRYAYLTDFDELLELPTHEEYLRARRAWERRHKVQNVELSVEVVPELKLSNLTGRQIWALLTAGFVGMVYVTTVSLVGPGGLLLFPVALLAWAAITRLPLIYRGTFSGGIPTRGASGNAV